MRGYEDIINLPHPTSKKHPRMAAIDRAAQFSPFAALTGFDAAIEETARLTAGKIELHEDEREELDRRLRQALETGACVEITRFVPDSAKSGGSYETVTGSVAALDHVNRRVVLSSGTRIPVEDILDVIISEKIT